MAATGSPGSGGSDELFAEPAVAQPLITQGAAIGSKAATGGASHAASSLPRTTATTPFDAAVQAALTALAQQDAGASLTSTTSANTHAAGAEAAVNSVVTEEAQSAQRLNRVTDQIGRSQGYKGYAATMPPVAVPSTGGTPSAGAGGGPSPVLGSMRRPSVASPALSIGPAPSPPQPSRSHRQP